MGKITRKSRKRNLKTSTFFRQFFCIFFGCTNLLCIGIIILLKHCSIDFYSVNDIMRHIFPAILFVGALGWFAGYILDNPKRGLIIDYKDLILEELIKSNNKISNEELEQKLKIGTKDFDNDENFEADNFNFSDGDFDLGESKLEL